MPCSEKNRLAMHKYKGLVAREQLYKDPVDGIFEDTTKSILQELSQELDDESVSDTDSMKQKTSTQWMRARTPIIDQLL